MSVSRGDQQEGGQEHHGQAGQDEGPGGERGGEEDTREPVMMGITVLRYYSLTVLPGRKRSRLW